jgi:DNA-directed RNA polymerase subunit RPC12/RpoP
MSEFKYACPVCGQHIKCDSSQAGSVMDCPTCFQKITVPQAPASDDQKFILTGSKVTEKKTSVPAAAGGVAAPEKKFPAAVVLVLLLVVGLAGAAVFAWRGKIFKTGKSSPLKIVAVTNAVPPKPKLIAPPANDTNWMLTLGTNAIPEAPVAGRIHGQDFIVERAYFFTNGTLTIRASARNPVEFGLTINFGGAPPESLSGQPLNVTTNADKAAKVTLHWKDASGTAQNKNYDDKYAMRLEFGALAKNHIRGKIYLCTPDTEKSYLMGTFNASLPRKGPPKK